MRWASRRAGRAQAEGWRMRRWSSEPRRMSVVEGRVTASLVRTSRVLSVCFIYTHETLKARSVSRIFKHFYEILSFRFGARLPRTPPRRNDDARFVVALQISSDPEQVTFSEQRTDSLPFEKPLQPLSVTLKKAISLYESAASGFRDTH